MAIERQSRIVVTGGKGFLGRYVVEGLESLGYRNVFIPKHQEYDLTEREACYRVVEGADYVIHLAAQIGGIGFIDKNPGEIFYNNAVMGIELMEAARKRGVKKLLIAGTVCEYPSKTQLPFHESSLWEGYPDEVTGPYGWAKKLLIVQGAAYRKQYGLSVIHLLPVNLYGPRDNFNKELSHVIPALIKRFVSAKDTGAKEVVVWGTGKASREFLYVEDAARGIILALEKYDSNEPLNLGTGVETYVRELVELISELVGYNGKIVWDTTKPDGQERRRLDISRAKEELGFVAETGLKEGLERTIRWYEKNKE